MPDVSPLYQTVKPDGGIDFNFPGGLSLLEGIGAAPFPVSRTITWNRESDGTTIATIQAYETTPPPAQAVAQLYNVVLPPTVAGNTYITQDQQLATAELQLHTQASPNNAQALVRTADYVTGLDTRKVLLSSDGSSEYQLKTPGFGVMHAGPIASAAPPNGTSGDSFTITTPGLYLFHFNGNTYSSTGGLLVYMELYVDGGYIISTWHYVTQPNTWQSFPGAFAHINLTRGTHYVWQRTALGNAQSDSNARFWWTATPA